MTYHSAMASFEFQNFMGFPFIRDIHLNMSGGGSGADRFAFSRFGEKRKIGSDTAGYDEYIEGVEPDETSSLDAPIKEDNVGFRLIQKMGWTSGTGLGKFKQGRVDPVPFELKDDHMGLGRWALELELAQDATEKRKQMEIEKELTEDLLEKYKAKAEKEKQMAETLAEMHKSFYCELCDRQYTKYSEYDNHINSYSHHHQQRLKDLKQYETGRRFGGHRDPEEQRKKIIAAHMVALERAKMNIKRKSKGGFAPAFKPIGQSSSNQSSTTTAATQQSEYGIKRPLEAGEDKTKITQKKAKIAKFGLKFQSAGTLVSIGEQPVATKTQERLQGGHQMESDRSESQAHAKKSVVIKPSNEASNSGTETKLSFGFQKKPQSLANTNSYSSSWTTATSSQPNMSSRKDGDSNKGPPPKLMSRQRELTMQRAFDSDSEEEDNSLTKFPVKTARKFKFNLSK